MPAKRTTCLLALALMLGTGCVRDEERLVVYAAGSLARPLRAALDSFALQHGVRVDLETAGSLETARKLTELDKIPDVIALADEEVFPQLLMPRFVTWYARFARNRMVIAYTERSRYADALREETWRDILTRDGVQVGRADPDLDPAGYRTHIVWQLAERHYNDSGLSQRLLGNASRRNMRGKSAELVALLQAGEIDYKWGYESVAQAANLRYLTLLPAIDLGSTAESTTYAAASVPVLGATRGDSIVMAGRPIRYAVSIPSGAANQDLAMRFVQWMLAPGGATAMRTQHLDVLTDPEFVGSPPSRFQRNP